jgi:hypothetical protein
VDAAGSPLESDASTGGGSGRFLERHPQLGVLGVRGTIRVDAEFRLLAGAVNLARLAVVGTRGTAHGWAAAT